ncbi:MAG: hypothetical protein N2689_11865, partial [Verrucomicrobiae bacterium]|nr:hypothetical protein [Verrucomicrobiae bacterium]
QDDYPVTIVHREELTAEQNKLVTGLKERGFFVRTAALEKATAGSLKSAAETVRRDGVPRMVLCLPPSSGMDAAAWSAPLDAKSVETLGASPARREVFDKLTTGYAAVWLFLPGGDTAKDGAARTLLRSTLKELEPELQLPEAMLESLDAKTAEEAKEKLRIRFAITEVKRDDSDEPVLLSILRTVAPEELAKPLPMVVPIFGRGRALHLVVGEDINADNIREICYFLTGSCSCEVKAMNPGFDLFIPGDWEARLMEGYVDAVNMAQVTGPSVAAPTNQPAVKPDPPPKAETARPPAESSLTRNLAAVLVALLAAVAAGGILLHRKKTRP